MFRPDCVDIKPSRQCFVFIGLLVFLCLLSGWLANVNSVFFLLLISLLVVARYLFRQYVFLLNTQAVVGVVWKASGWWLLLKNGEMKAVFLDSASVVSRHVLFLSFVDEAEGDTKRRWFNKWGSHRHSVLLFADSADSKSLRRLRVCVLQAKNQPAVASENG